jgi:hypothetical protein
VFFWGGGMKSLQCRHLCSFQGKAACLSNIIHHFTSHFNRTAQFQGKNILILDMCIPSRMSVLSEFYAWICCT